MPPLYRCAQKRKSIYAQPHPCGSKIHDYKGLNGKRVLIVDDVISTGESLAAMEDLVKQFGGNIVGRACVLAEGDAADRKDIIFLEALPLFAK